MKTIPIEIISLRPMPHPQICRATLSRDTVAVQLFMTHTAILSHKQELTNQRSAIKFIEPSIALFETRVLRLFKNQVTLPILSLDKVARQRCASLCDKIAGVTLV